MEKFKLIQELGQGSYGCVSKAIDKTSGEVVAIKKLKRRYYTLQDCLNLREVQSLRRMHKNPHIIQLKELILEHNVLFMVFECMDSDLYQVMRDRRHFKFTEYEVREWLFQIFHGLAYMRKAGYFHHDLKPDNLLVKGTTVQIVDLDLAREIDSQPPYTEYVTTRWYRAPEVLLGSQGYCSKVDMWSMGAIMAELFTFSPLFPGKNAFDQMAKICKTIGTPTMESWSDGLCLARNMGYQFPENNGTNLSLLIPSASKDAVSLIKLLCSWDPRKRTTAAEALQHPFFQDCYSIPPTPVSSIRYNKEHLQAITRNMLQSLEI